MNFWTVETIVGFSGGRLGLRSRFSDCSDAIAHALGDELLLEVGDSTGGFEQLAQRPALTRWLPGWGWTRRSASPGGVKALSAPLA